MTPPRLFRSATFMGANLLTLLLYRALNGGFFVVRFALVRCMAGCYVGDFAV